MIVIVEAKMLVVISVLGCTSVTKITLVSIIVEVITRTLTEEVSMLSTVFEVGNSPTKTVDCNENDVNGAIVIIVSLVVASMVSKITVCTVTLKVD